MAHRHERAHSAMLPSKKMHVHSGFTFESKWNSVFSVWMAACFSLHMYPFYFFFLYSCYAVHLKLLDKCESDLISFHCGYWSVAWHCVRFFCLLFIVVVDEWIHNNALLIIFLNGRKCGRRWWWLCRKRLKLNACNTIWSTWMQDRNWIVRKREFKWKHSIVIIKYD